MRNLIILNHNAGSPYHGPNFRSYYTAKYLQKLGWTVTIISSSFAHKYYSLPKVTKSISEEYIDGIHYLWVRTKSFSGYKGRLFNYLQFCSKLLLLSPYLNDAKPDALICSSPPPLLAFPAYCISRYLSIPMVFEVRDLWPLGIVEMKGLSHNHPVVMIMALAEKIAYKYADAIACVLPGAEPYMQSKGLAEGKFNYIPNGIDLELESSFKKYSISESFCSLIPKEGLIVGFVGSIGESCGLNYLIQAANLVKDHKIFFIIVGEGSYKNKLIEMARELDNVIFLDAVPKNSVQFILRKFDVCYLEGSYEEMFVKYGVNPNKAYDYMLAAKPILNTLQAYNDIVKEGDCGISVDSENPKAIAEAVINFKNMSPYRRKNLGQNGLKHVCENYNYQIIASKYADLIVSLIGEKNKKKSL